ncbi:hypothetical protein [Desulfonatronum thiosulfatophilum]|nr:hypothetical protein [Desulfonatronum thiosulfatophilum]
MTAGIPKILVVLRQQAGWDALLLTSLELCGAEVVCHMDDPTILDTLRRMTELDANGTILALDDVDTLFLDAEPAFAGVDVWRLQAGLPIRIWHETPDEWEWNVLLRNHPATPLEVWGPLQDQAPNSIQPNSGTWDQFCRGSRVTLGVGSHLLSDTALPSTGLIFTPGQEGCWFWPNLPADVFYLHGMVLACSNAYS